MSDQAQEQFREAEQQLRVIGADGDGDEVYQWCAAGRFCWLDLENPDSDTVSKVGEALAAPAGDRGHPGGRAAPHGRRAR